MVPTNLLSSGLAVYYYNEARKWFTILNTLTTPVLFVINAPFGRFTPTNQASPFVVDGRKAWICMELVSPLMFLTTFLSSPLTPSPHPLPSGLSTSALRSYLQENPHVILALCYLTHYLNRALLSPLRTPSRSKTHIIVPLWGVVFNTINGSLMGTYLASSAARRYVVQSLEVHRWTFVLGLVLWVTGFTGNVWHDEVLLDIRRKAGVKSEGKGKGKEADGKSGNGKGEHYAIPQGGLYSLISYPNYFCEWVEWLGYAIAASPLPFTLSSLTLSTLTSLLAPSTLTTLLSLQTYKDILATPGTHFLPSLTPPWIFLLSEVLLMLPRAYKGHQWYHQKFGAAYPRERKAAIPFVL